MSLTLHDKLTALVDHIYGQEKEAFKFVYDAGWLWQAKPPLFPEPLMVAELNYEKKVALSPSGVPKERLQKAALHYDDSSIYVGMLAASALSDNDPMGCYFLEKITEIYSKHDHQICLGSIAQIRSNGTTFGAGYRERVAHHLKERQNG